eukprot:352577_1
MNAISHSKYVAALHDEKGDWDEENDAWITYIFEEIKKTRKSKKKSGSTHDMSAFAAEVMSAKKSIKKLLKHGSSKKKGKRGRKSKDSEAIYASNVRSKSFMR